MLNKFFRSMERLDDSLNRRNYKLAPVRSLSESDFDSFEDATKRRKPPTNREEIIRILKQKNWVRMRRLQKDFRWVQREMRKMGLNPENARELL